MNTQSKSLFVRSAFVIALTLAATSGAAYACVENSEPEEAQTTCPCTGLPTETLACVHEEDYYGWCSYDIPGDYCGEKNGNDCYVGVAYDDPDCPPSHKPKLASLIRDEFELNFTRVGGAKPRACGDVETLMKWLETAPGFPAQRSHNSAGL